MTAIKWTVRLLADIFRMGLANRSLALSLAILLLLFLGLVIVGAQISAPFIYTLF